MKIKFALALALLAAAPLAPALMIYAQARPANVAVRTPKPGSKERAAIMNALRVPLTQFHKGKRVTFTGVEEFRVGGGWAFLMCLPVDDKGKNLGPRDLPFLTALLRYQKGKWSAVEWAYAGDVVQIGWARKHADVPLNVLGLKPSDLG